MHANDRPTGPTAATERAMASRRWTGRIVALSVATLAVTVLGPPAVSPAAAQGVLRIGMTASDIPLTTGQTDQGAEGMRFMGYTVYDALINWDLSSADKASDLVPGLATRWVVDEADKSKWIFTLRDGVKFH